MSNVADVLADTQMCLFVLISRETPRWAPQSPRAKALPKLRQSQRALYPSLSSTEHLEVAEVHIQQTHLHAQEGLRLWLLAHWVKILFPHK